MYYSRLSVLQELLNEDNINKIDEYFSSLIGSARNSITVSKIVKKTGISAHLVSRSLTKCMENSILNVAYSIRCPNCGMLIKKVESITEIPHESFECYNCGEEIEIKPDSIELIYSLADDDSVFIAGQQKDADTSARSVAPEDSMDLIFQAGGVNEHLFRPTDADYERLKELYSRVMQCKGSTKAKGDTLESLTIELFNLCPIFKAAGIKTKTNQIDCFVRNKMYLNYGVLQTLGARFFIECKNENATPEGGYMSKLHSIISTTNASSDGECAKFGIIISKFKGPCTFKELATKYYLKEKVIIISICGAELKALFDNKGNLLELIERKATEIMLDAKTDLIESGLYDI